jgi:hypothetical protein
MASCTCTLTNANTGTPNKQPIEKVGKKIYLQQLIADDGTVNEIDCAGTLDQAALDALINNADDSKRLYPLPLIDNIEDVRADAILETLNSGQNIKVQDGTRTFTGVIVSQGPVFLGQLENWSCGKFGAYAIDDCGAMIGNGATAGKLRPIRIDERNWNPQLVKSTDTTVQKVALNFEWARTEKDSSLRMLTAEDWTDADLLGAEGLLDITGTASAITTTGFTMAITTLYGSCATPVVVPGLVLGDFSLFNVTDSLTARS